MTASGRGRGTGSVLASEGEALAQRATPDKMFHGEVPLSATHCFSNREEIEILPEPRHRLKPTRVHQGLNPTIFDIHDCPRTPEKPSLPLTRPTSLSG